VRPSSNVRGRENLCGKEGKVLHGAFVSKLCDTVQIETTYWSDEEIRV
jgi:hypothetical protein